MSYGMAILLSMSNSLKPLEAPSFFFQGILSGEWNLPKGAVPHLLGIIQEHCIILCDSLHEYHNIFPW